MIFVLVWKLVDFFKIFLDFLICLNWMLLKVNLKEKAGVTVKIKKKLVLLVGWRFLYM